MHKKDIILIGAGGHSHACIDVIEECNQFNIVGFVGLPEELGEKHFGYTVVATDDDIKRLSKEYRYAFITLGQIHSPQLRAHLYDKASMEGFDIPTIVSPTSTVSKHAHVGKGSIIMHGAVVNAGAVIGENCIINTLSLIEHDTSVGDNCHISTRVVLNGNVNVGDLSFIGSGSVIKECLTVGRECVVGMGLAVRHDLNDNIKFLGYS